MYVWTKKEIAKALGVSRSLPSVWVNAWGSDSHHPFPTPVARVQTPVIGNRAGWTQKQNAYDPMEIREWFADLSEAQTQRMSESHRLPHKRNRGSITMSPSRVIAQAAVADMREALAGMKAIRDDLEALKVLVRRPDLTERGF